MASRMKKGLAAQAARQLAPRVTTLAPGLTETFVREALLRAIHGVGPLPPAADAAEEQLREQHGDRDKAVREVIENHVFYASVEGLLTNLGGLVTATLVAPANIVGLTVIQSRMVAGIVHLRGYDLAEPRVRNAIMVSLLGEETVGKLIAAGKVPAPPMALATAPAHDPQLDRVVSGVLAGELVGRVIGKRMATTVGRRVPLVGGAVGMATDGISTWQVGRYAAREFLVRPGVRVSPVSR
ncbi:EcsC family protein [Nocardioides sambongensis]|uniref:EcsC family protein n=1 Tax=Nocardioides sambongensis TaxID=2589074 RepID=UPI001E2AEFDB|nr:EcsC family protein [Nocardioides sambongensis]